MRLEPGYPNIVIDPAMHERLVKVIMPNDTPKVSIETIVVMAEPVLRGPVTHVRIHFVARSTDGPVGQYAGTYKIAVLDQPVG